MTNRHTRAVGVLTTASALEVTYGEMENCKDDGCRVPLVRTKECAEVARPREQDRTVKENIELPQNVTHQRDWDAPRLPDPNGEYGHWSQPLCGYCGSLPATVLLELLKDHPDVRLSVADWKYGYPHKIYIDSLPVPQRILDMKLERVVSSRYDNGVRTILATEPYTHDFAKFYTAHLQDIASEPYDQQFEELSDILLPRTGVLFRKDDNRNVMWKGM